MIRGVRCSFGGVAGRVRCGSCCSFAGILGRLSGGSRSFATTRLRERSGRNQRSDGKERDVAGIKFFHGNTGGRRC